jgi:isopentenyldiphosphate isomerase
MTTTRDNLIAGQVVILDPKHWTTNVYAKTANGNPIGSSEVNACRWCSIGALNKITRHHPELYTPVFEALCREMNFHVINFNDTQSHDAVIAAWDRAIEATP